MSIVCTAKIRVFFFYLPISTTYSLVYIVLNVWTKRQEPEKLCKIENEILFSLSHSRLAMLTLYFSALLITQLRKKRPVLVWNTKFRSLKFSRFSRFSEFSFSFPFNTGTFYSLRKFFRSTQRCLCERANLVSFHTVAEFLQSNMNSFQGLSYDDLVTLIFFFFFAALRLLLNPRESVNKQRKTTHYWIESFKSETNHNRNFS